MPRRIEKTQRVLDRLPPDIDSGSIVVFEAIAADTNPIDKRGSLYDRGRISANLLREMAEYIQAGNTVPLHTLHMQGMELPIGTVFHGEFFGDTEDLRVLFYLGESEQDLITKLDNGTINAVSVGVKSQHLYCSECGFDYFGPEATFDNLWEKTCANGHTIGVDGTHVRLIGLDRWMETSLVSRGGVPRATIQSRSKSLLSHFTDDEKQALAASGVDPRATILVAVREEPEMPDDNNKPSVGLAADVLLDRLLKAETGNATKDTEISTLQAQVTSLTEQVEQLKASVNTDVDALKKDSESLDKAVEFLKDQAKKALVASGQADPQVPETVEDLIASITDASVNLVNLNLPVGGKGKGPETDLEADRKPVTSNAFKSRK